MTDIEIKSLCTSGSLIAEAQKTFCDGVICDSADMDTCCEPAPPPSGTGTGTSGSGTSGGGTTTSGGGTGSGTGGSSGGGSSGGTTSGGGTGTGASGDTKSPGTDESNRVCKPATCTCSNGTPAKGAACIYNKAEYCLNCNKGFYHTISMPGIASCKPCKTGSYQDAWMSTATKCKKWTVCSAVDAQVGQSVVKHAIKIVGINADTFNIELNMKTSFIAAVVQILGVNEAFIQNVRAISKKPDCSSSPRFLSGTKDSCFVLYELVFDTKQKADAMEAKIDASTGLMQTASMFTVALKNAMQQNNVPQNVVSSFEATTPDLTATEDKRLDGIDTKSSSTNGGDASGDISGDASTGENSGNSPSGTNKDESAGIAVGVVFLVLAIFGVAIGAGWYFYGQKKCSKNTPEPDNIFEHPQSIHVTNPAAVELSTRSPSMPPRPNATRSPTMPPRSNESYLGAPARRTSLEIESPQTS